MGEQESDLHAKEIFSRSRCLPFSCGALRYMAPEVAYGQQSISPASDVYSLGLLLWSLISGVDPYKGITRSSFYSSVVHYGERPCCKISWPEPIRDIVRLCWSTDPESRPSASAVSAFSLSLKPPSPYNTKPNTTTYLDLTGRNGSQ